MHLPLKKLETPLLPLLESLLLPRENGNEYLFPDLDFLQSVVSTNRRIGLAFAACKESDDDLYSCYNTIEKLPKGDRVPALRRAISEGLKGAATALLSLENAFEPEFCLEIFEAYLKANFNNQFVGERLVHCVSSKEATKEAALSLANKYNEKYLAEIISPPTADNDKHDRAKTDNAGNRPPTDTAPPPLTSSKKATVPSARR